MSKAIGELIAGIAIIALDIVAPYVGLALTPQLVTMLATAGASLIMGGIGSLLTKQQQGLAGNVRNAIQPWNVVYGRAKVGGTILYTATNGETDKYLHMVFVLACHPSQSIDALIFDQKRVCLDTSGNSLSFVDSTAVIASNQTVNIAQIVRNEGLVVITLANPIPLPAGTAAGPAVMDGDTIVVQNITTDPTLNDLVRIQVIDSLHLAYTSGGANVSISGQGQVVTTWPDYGDTVHMEVALGNQTTAPFPTLLGAGTQWNSACLVGGRTAVYVRLKYGGNTYAASGIPHIAFLMHGKNNIYDPRTSLSSYSENAALCIADFLCQQTWGFKCAMGTDVPAANLITAANICDESVALANGSTEPRYALNGTFQLSARRGEILQNMLTSCGGRITYSGGQYVIWPAYWPGVTSQFGTKAMTSAVLNIVSSYATGTINYAGTSGFADGVITLWNTNNFTGGQPLYFSNGGSPYCNDIGWSLQTQGFQLLPSGPNPSGVQAYSSGIQNSVYSPTQSYDSSSLAGLLSTLSVSCYVWSSEPGATATGLALDIYEISLTVTFADGSTITYRPQNATIQAGTDGGHTTVTNPGNAIDGNTATFATVSGTVFGTFPPGTATLFLSSFAASTASVVGTPDLTDTSKLSLTDAAGPFQWRPKLPGRDLYNGVKGKFVSTVNGWYAADFPPYAQDPTHGYASDANLAADGGDRRWFDMELPFTISNPCAQRLAKIELMRRRMQGTGTFSYNMAVYGLTALDVIEYTLPILGWTNKLLEISNFRFVPEKDPERGDEAGWRLGCELDMQETDPSVYAWSTSEELNYIGSSSSVPPTNNGLTVAAPINVVAISGPSVAVVSGNGTIAQIQITWDASTDGYVINGGQTLVQYQIVGSTGWVALGSYDPSVTVAYISNVTDGQQYLVRVAFVNILGVQSAWTQAGPVTASGGSTSPIGVNGSPTVEVNGAPASYDDIVEVNGNVVGDLPSSGGSTTSPGSGSTGATGLTLGQQLAADMTGTNEGHPQGVPSSYSFYTGPSLAMGNNPDFSNGQVAYALEWWGGVYFGPSGNPATNSQVNVRNMTLCWLRNSTQAWETVVFTAADISSDFFSADFTTDYSTPVPMTTESDGSIAFTTQTNEVAHFYAPYPRVSIDPTDLAGVIAYCEARLILINSGGTNDMASAELLLDCGADYYPTATGAGIENNPGVGLGKFKYVGKTPSGAFNNGWRSFAMTTLTQAQIDANPPPINISGILP